MSTTSSRSSRPACTSGSFSNTSRPAPAISPASSAATDEASSTTGPRAVLTRKAVRFMACSCGVLMRWWVSGEYGQCSDTTSLMASSSSIET